MNGTWNVANTVPSTGSKTDLLEIQRQEYKHMLVSFYLLLTLTILELAEMFHVTAGGFAFLPNWLSGLAATPSQIYVSVRAIQRDPLPRRRCYLKGNGHRPCGIGRLYIQCHFNAHKPSDCVFRYIDHAYHTDFVGCGRRTKGRDATLPAFSIPPTGDAPLSHSPRNREQIESKTKHCTSSVHAELSCWDV